MNPLLLERFGEIIESTGVEPKRALEVGGRTGANSLLRFPSVLAAERVCLNLLEDLESSDGITGVIGNANSMDMFDDASFDLVVCNAMLEHDAFFWTSLAEMKRVLRRGGLLIVGVPGYVSDKDAARAGSRSSPRGSTLTVRFHTKVDLYRFSPMAVERVFLQGLRETTVEAILDPPRIIGYGWKP